MKNAAAYIGNGHSFSTAMESSVPLRDDAQRRVKEIWVKVNNR